MEGPNAANGRSEGLEESCVTHHEPSQTALPPFFLYFAPFFFFEGLEKVEDLLLMVPSSRSLGIAYFKVSISLFIVFLSSLCFIFRV